MLAAIVCLGHPHHLPLPGLSPVPAPLAALLSAHVPLPPVFSSRQVSSPARTRTAPLCRDTHTHALGCISEVSHLDISPFPARPGTQREANPALAYLPSAPGLNRGQQPCVGSRGCESAERCQCQGCMLRLSAAPAASPPPAPRCCVAMRSHPREEQHLCPQQEVPLAPHAGGGTRTTPRPLELPWRSAPRRGGRGVEMQRQTRAREEETKHTWREKVGGEGKRRGGVFPLAHKRSRGLTSGDLPRAAGLGHASRRLPTSPRRFLGVTALILGYIRPCVCVLENARHIHLVS